MNVNRVQREFSILLKLKHATITPCPKFHAISDLSDSGYFIIREVQLHHT